MKIFVYGTLKSGHCRNHMLREQKLLGKVCTEPNYKLYDLGSYPGLRREKDGISIQGELWEIDDACREYLDYIEGHPSLFKRTEVLIEGHEDVAAYLYQGSFQGGEDIGDCWNGD